MWGQALSEPYCPNPSPWDGAAQRPTGSGQVTERPISDTASAATAPTDSPHMPHTAYEQPPLRLTVSPRPRGRQPNSRRPNSRRILREDPANLDNACRQRQRRSRQAEASLAARGRRLPPSLAYGTVRQDTSLPRWCPGSHADRLTSGAPLRPVPHPRRRCPVSSSASPGPDG